MKKVAVFLLIAILTLTTTTASAINLNDLMYPIINAPESNYPNNQTTDVPTPTAAPTNSTYEEKVAQLVNVEREKNGLPPLHFDKTVSNVARAKSQDMAANNYFAHQSPTYGSAGNMLNKFGVTWSVWGENIASGQRTPEEVVSDWMNSPSHRENILSPNFAFIGVGYATNSNGKTYWTQMFTNDDK